MPRKRKSKHKVIKLEFPDYMTIHVAWVHDVVEYRNGDMLKRWPKLPTYHNNDVFGLYTVRHSDYPNVHWITIQHGASFPYIAHEVIHCVDAIMSWFGFTETEFRAYMAEKILIKIIE